MYYIEDKDQLVIENFSMPFGGKLSPKNRWVRLAGIMPWEQIEEIYLRTMSVETGRRAFPSRVAPGAENSERKKLVRCTRTLVNAMPWKAETAT